MFIVRCDQCGQSDDHPKVHTFDGKTYHHDCLPFDLRAEVCANPKAAQIVAAAESGIRGDQLRNHIFQLHQEG